MYYLNHLVLVLKLNMATATVNALKSLKTAEHVAELRGKSVEEILG